MAEITADERIEKIVSDCLDLIDYQLKNTTITHSSPLSTVSSVGESLKALAEGVDAYKKVMSKPEVVGVA